MRWAGRQYKIFRSQRRKRVCRDLSPDRANAILEYLYHHNVCNSVRFLVSIQGYLVHQKQRPPRNLQ